MSAACVKTGGVYRPPRRQKLPKHGQSMHRGLMRKFHLPHGRNVTAKAAGFLFRVRNDDEDTRLVPEYNVGDFDGLITSDKLHWDDNLESIRSMEFSGKTISILGMDSPDDFMPPTWIEIMQLRDAFMSSGAKSVDYIHYEDDIFRDM